MNQKRIAFFAANKIGLEIIKFAVSQSFPIEFVATCSSDKEEYEKNIVLESEAAGVTVLRKIDPNSEQFQHTLLEKNLDVVFLTWWPKIIKKRAIDLAKEGWVNMHPSLLPFGRGKYPYYWAIVEESPYGVSLHLIDEGVDTGPILFQQEIKISPTDTGETLYTKSERALVDLFKQSYEKMVTAPLVSKSQDLNKGTSHFASELDNNKYLDLSKQYSGKDLINILRARTFFNGKSACFKDGDDIYSIKVIIEKVS